MDHDQFDQSPPPATPDSDPQNRVSVDPGVRISNTGQRIRGIAVVIIAVVALVAALVWYQGKKNEVAAHEQVRTDYQRVHTMGYVDFWTMTQVDIKEMKTNEDFEIRMKQLISDEPVRYAKYIKEKCLPILDKALPEYKAVSTPSAYADKMEGVAKAAEGLRGSWNTFADELLKYDDFLRGTKLLDPTANAWLGAQQSNDEKYTADAVKYYKLLGCVLLDKKVHEIPTTDINSTVQDSCLNDKAEWFRRVAFSCLPRLFEEGQEPDETYTIALETSRKSERMDHASKFAIEDCLKETRDAFESAIIEKVALSWADYIKAQNDLLAAIDGELEKLR